MKDLFFSKSPLRDRILSLFLVLACIPSLLLGWLTLVLLNYSHSHDIQVIELETLRAKGEEVAAFFTDLSGILDIRLEALDAEDISHEGILWQAQLTEALLNEHKEFMEIIFASPEGKEIARSSRSERPGPLLYVSQLPAFHEALKGIVYQGDVYFTNNGPRVVIASPIRAENTIVQVAIAEVDISPLVRSIAAHRIGESGYVVISDKRGAFVDLGQKGLLKPGERMSPIMEQVKSASRYESIISGVPVAAASFPIPSIGWTLVAEWPLSEADAVMSDIRRQVLIVVAVSILAVVLIAPLFTARIVRPIRALELGAKRIEKGDFEKQVSITTGDELEKLGNAFNTMARGLKRLQELRNEFVFVAAHELRAPVTVIKGYVSMVLEGSAGVITKETKEFLGRAQSANQQLLQLVSDLLEIARSEANRIEIQVAPMDARIPINEVVAELAPFAAEKRITVSYDCPQNAVMVQADSVRLKEVVMNFITNAVKYNREQGTVSVSHEVKENTIITRVRDTGFGIPKEEQKKIFEKFYRTVSARKSGVQGTGLGLFITKELIERMGGTIWFVSEKDKGTTFSFSLPSAHGTMKK